MAAAPSHAFAAALVLLAADAAIELGFVTSMVSYLHSGAPSGVFVVNTPHSASNTTYEIAGKPLNMLVNQGHTSNGAAGTALVLIGLVGMLALAGRQLGHASTTAGSGYRPAALGRLLYHAWLAVHVPALLLTLGALAYVFAETTRHRGQTIDQALAAQIQDPRHHPYPLNAWTPQNWFSAVLQQLDLADAAHSGGFDLRADLAHHLRIMRGWQYNLIPLAVLQIAETVLAFADFRRWRSHTRNNATSKYRSSDDGGADGGRGTAWQIYSGRA